MVNSVQKEKKNIHMGGGGGGGRQQLSKQTHYNFFLLNSIQRFLVIYPSSLCIRKPKATLFVRYKEVRVGGGGGGGGGGGCYG